MNHTIKTAQFTPGPYELRGSRLLTDSNGVVLADNIGANWPGTIEGQANLFAAAPAMYAIIKDMREAFYVKGTRKALLEVMERSKDVLSQAEGR